MEHSIQVGSISNAHSNHESRTSQDMGLAQEGSCERRSSLTLFIPTNVDIDRLLEVNPPNFPYHRDCFVYIMHIITAIPSKDWELMDAQGFSNVCKKILQKRIHKYKAYVRYLVQNGIIQESTYYIPGKKSRGIRFCRRYQSDLKPIIITKWTLIKSIIGYHAKINVQKTQEIHFLKKWFNPKIQVDLEGAQTFLQALKPQKELNGSSHAQLAYNSRLLPLLELAHGEYSFGVDNTGFRLHTTLTRTMKELRKFITYNRETLHSVDIVNSQPFLARPLFDECYFTKNDIIGKIINTNLTKQQSFPIMIVKMIREIKTQPDVKTYLKIVTEGTFYESFGRLLISNGLFEGEVVNTSVRTIVKKITMSALFNANTAIGWNPHIRIFAQIFPAVYGMIKLIKKGNGKHPAYSIMLQRLEAELILDKVCVRINKAYPHIPIFTIHDSIVTTEKYVTVVQNFVKKIMRQNVGASPQLKVETWE